MDNDIKKMSESVKKKKRIVRYDEKGNPIPAKKRPVRYDENGKPIQAKKRPRKTEADRPIPLRKKDEAAKSESFSYEEVNKNTKNRRVRTKSEGKSQTVKKKSKNYVGIILASMQAVVSIAFFVILLLLDMLPIKYLVVIGVILAVLLGFTILSQFARAGKKVGWVFAGIMILLFGVASVYIWKAHDVIDEVTQIEAPTTKLSDVSIIVMSDSAYDGLEDLEGKDFGVQKVIDRKNTDLTLTELESEMNATVNTTEFESWKSQVQALYNGDVDAIVINELYRSLILDDFEDFDEDTRILDGFEHVEKVEKAEQESSKANIMVDTEPFNVYLSGNDAYGKINLEAGRSDVNIIATVNPKTKQILLTTTPRDYYVELPFYGGGYYDKLTHTGLFEFDTTIETLENLYQIEIDYYIRLNFSGFRDIVDALDGVEVYSEYEFTSVKGVYFSQGLNYLNGKEALAFVRERKAFADGDFQRGKNQMAMIEALADKVFSPAILTNYMDLMDSVSSCFVTDIPRGKINDLVKMQLNDGAEWTIISNSVMGYSNARITYLGGSEPLSCIDPDVGDVALATELIQKCMNGEKVVIPDKEAAGIYQGSNLGSIGLNYSIEQVDSVVSSGTEISSTGTENGDTGVSSDQTVSGSENTGDSAMNSTSAIPNENQTSDPTVDSNVETGEVSSSGGDSASQDVNQETSTEVLENANTGNGDAVDSTQ